MNNKELYIDVISRIQPSEDVIERIMDMTNQKNKFRPRKSLIAVLVVIAMLAFGGITANAATDGAVAEYISNTVKVLVNGKETDSTVTTDENGEKHVKIDADIKDGENEIIVNNEETGEEEIVHYEIEFEDGGVEWSSSGSKSGITIETHNFQEPTTSVQE